MAAFKLYIQSGNQRKIGWVGDYIHVAFGQKFPDEKGSEIMCCDVTASSHQSSGQTLRTFSRSHRKTSQ
jgi:hypothetical protein